MPARRATSQGWYNSGGLENVVALRAAASGAMASSTCADVSFSEGGVGGWK